MSNHPLCEVRVITHKRPVWLKRALQSLQAQTCQAWVAHVHDDSPEREGEAVVRLLSDPRIQYLPNEVNLGAAANLDQAFAAEARFGAEFAFILEDDNWLLPRFIEANVKLLDQRGGNLLMRNQWIAHQRDFSPAYELTSQTTLETWYSEGIFSPFDVRARMLLMQGVSNGGLFWRLGHGQRLQVGPLVRDSGLQEFCRAWQHEGQLNIGMEPLAVWSRTHVGTQPYTKTMIRSSTRGFQSIRREVVRRHGLQLVEACLSCTPPSYMRPYAHALAMAVAPNPRLLRRFGPIYLRHWFFSCLRYWLVTDPLKAYLEQPYTHVDEAELRNSAP